MKKNIYLIDLGTGTDRSLIPLGCGLIVSYAKTDELIDKNFNFDILMMENKIEEIIDQLYNPYIVAFACYVWNFLGCQELAHLIKKKFPKTKIVFGGPSIPQDNTKIKEFMKDHKYVDILVHMEGEKTFSDILIHDLKDKHLSSCNGISFRDKNYSIVTTEKRERIKDLSEIPSPYLTGVFDKLYEKYKKFIVGILWETNRGCPFSCSFCDWGNASVNKVTRYSIHRVVDEIKWASDRKIHYVYCTDANYGIKFDRDYEITEKVVEIVKKNKFPNTFVLNWTKNQHKNVIRIAEKFREAEIATNTTISLQSFHPPTIEAIKRGNIKMEEYMSLKNQYHTQGLSTYTELILGLPKETPKTFLDGLDMTMSHNMYDQFMVYTANILENTDLSRNIEKYNIKTSKCAVGLNRRRLKYSRFGEDEIVIGTDTMPVKEWERVYKLSFLILSLYNLRIAFLPIVFLNKHHSIKITELVEYIIKHVSEESSAYPTFSKAIEHLNKQTKLIVNGVSSVSETENSEGVVFTPHEATTFIFSSYLDETYNELHKMLKKYVREKNIDVNELFLEESILFQKLMIPSFISGKSTKVFKTNAPYSLYKLVTEDKNIKLKEVKNSVSIYHPKHEFDNLVEFNRRRVSSGYSIGMSKVEFDKNIFEINIVEKEKSNNNKIANPGNFISSENQTGFD